MSTSLMGTALSWERELGIPAPPPTARRLPRGHVVTWAGRRPRLPAWREAMIGTLVGLLGSWAIGEAVLYLSGF